MVGKECYKEINRHLNQQLREKKTLIAVHRGIWGGNLVENTIPALDLVYRMGADIAECDLSASIDGELYLFHDGNERRLLNLDQNIMSLPSAEIDELILRNSLGLQSGKRVQKFEEMLACFHHGELINIDRSWRAGLQHTLDVMKKYPHMLGQALIKTPVTEEYLEIMASYPEKYMYIPIVRYLEEIDKVLAYENINLVGIEVIAKNDESELFQPATIDQIHRQGLFVWVNTLVLSGLEKHALYGSINDDRAVSGNPDETWGILMNRSVDVIQTDWPINLIHYRDEHMLKSKGDDHLYDEK